MEKWTFAEFRRQNFKKLAKMEDNIL